MANVEGSENNALGDLALRSNTSGFGNTAVGDDAGIGITSGNANVCIGDESGIGISAGNNIITIGAVSGLSTTDGEVDDSCYIDNIFDGAIDFETARMVGVDQDGKLGMISFLSRAANKLG